MVKDFIEIGDQFNHEGTRYWVKRIPTARTLALSLAKTFVGPLFLYSVTGDAVIRWLKEDNEWGAVGGTVQEIREW